LPQKGSARRKPPRARGPSAPSAERARYPCHRSLALHVGKRAPLPSAPSAREGSTP
jgi:hypothetical protein